MIVEAEQHQKIIWKNLYEMIITLNEAFKKVIEKQNSYLRVFAAKWNQNNDKAKAITLPTI